MMIESRLNFKYRPPRLYGAYTFYFLPLEVRTMSNKGVLETARTHVVDAQSTRFG